MKKCVLAYSGGLDTSAIIPWLKEHYNMEVIAYCCNVGNLPPKEFLKERGMKLGASDFVYEEAESEFVSDYVYPMLKSGATYYDDYLLGTAIARPLIAKKVAQFAKKIQADFIAHGATGKGNDHLRFERAWAYLCPQIDIIAPWKIWKYRSREELVAFLEEKNYQWGDSSKRYSVDVNTFHRSCEGGDLEDLQTQYIKKEVHEWLSFEMPGPESILLKIDRGTVTSINGENLPPHEILLLLNKKAAKFGIGLCDIVEERINGIKSRGIYETPGGTVIHSALKALKQLCWSRELYTLSQVMADKYGQIIYDGLWFSDSCHALEGFFTMASEKLSGEIHLELNPGLVRVLGRKSPYSLYRPDVVSFESDSMDIHKAALGYTKIMSLTSLIQGQREAGL
jgi:argininosuccinate synthase